ncbi:MAG: type II toxin-antitoxin system RelE/ParE family toxin [archaeon]|nr:type II toxin-antitoxin system RelE/ParE family toxin [archaeon]
MKVFLSRKAKDFVEHSPADLRKRLENAISELMETPFPNSCKKLKGAPNSYRLRVGDYRVLYTILTRDEILVFKIATRGSAYD